MNSRNHEVVIVGGGIAGLAAAWALKERDIVLFESTDRVGGRIKTETRGDYWLNFGAHLIPGPKTHTGRMLTQLGLEPTPLPGSTSGVALNGKVLISGAIETYPFRLPMSLSARLSFIRAGLKMRSAVADFVREARPRPDEPEEETRARKLAFLGDISFADYLDRLHPDVAAIFQAESRRVTASMQTISAGCGVSHFVAAMSGSQGSSMRNLVGGAGLISEALLSAMDNRIELGSTVTGVASEDDGVHVRVRRGQEELNVLARCAIVATPAYVTQRIVKSLPQDTADALRAIPYGPFIVAAILTSEQEPMPWDGCYTVLCANKSFNMFSNQANVLRQPGQPRGPGGSLMVYAGGELAEQLMDLTDDKITDRFRRDLTDLFPESAHVVQEMVLQRWEKAIPYVGPGRYRLQPALERDLGDILIAGDYFDYPAVEGAVAAAMRAAARAKAKLDEPSTRSTPSGNRNE